MGRTHGRDASESDPQGTLYLAFDDRTKLVIIPGQDFAQENGEITGFTVVD